MKVSIQGEKGSFHYQVATILFGDNVDVLERASFREIFDDVEDSEAKFGLLAIENSIAGAILPNYDLLRDSGLQISGEYYLPIHHQLMALPGQEVKDISEVWSHPMALKQTQDFLLSHSHIKQVEADDTAGSARDVAESKATGVAAIASAQAAEIYGLEVIAENIETDEHNFTRFLVVEHEDQVRFDYKSDLFKSSLYVETPHESGALLRAMQVFDSFKYSMTMLVSRPIIGRPWEYGFYIDFVHQEQDIATFIGVLGKHAVSIQVLGTYKAHEQNGKVK